MVVECDGWESHGRNRLQFERDREKDATLVAAGHIVVHFTWRKLVRDPKWVVHRIRQALDRWGGHTVSRDLGVHVPGIREP